MHSRSVVLTLALTQLEVARDGCQDTRQDAQRRRGSDDVLLDLGVTLRQELKTPAQGAKHDDGQAEACG